MTDLSCLRGDLCFVSQMKDNNMPRGVKVERPVSTEPIEVMFLYLSFFFAVSHAQSNDHEFYV